MAVLDVEARIFIARRRANVLGIAPLTSMFLYGPNQQTDGVEHLPACDPRLQRPAASIPAAANGCGARSTTRAAVTVTHLHVEEPARLRLACSVAASSRAIEDLEDRYDLRPSAWIEPKGEWGKGKVELVRVADRRRDQRQHRRLLDGRGGGRSPEPGQALRLRLRMHWTTDEAALMPRNLHGSGRPSTPRARQTQASLDLRQPDGTTAFLVDFEGPPSTALPPDAAVKPEVGGWRRPRGTGTGTTLEARNPAIKGWRRGRCASR